MRAPSRSRFHQRLTWCGAPTSTDRLEVDRGEFNCPQCAAKPAPNSPVPMLMHAPLARDGRQPPDFIRPAQPVLADKVPSGDGWLHEPKHDGFRIVAHTD